MNLLQTTKMMVGVRHPIKMAAKSKPNRNKKKQEEIETKRRNWK
jgi:hypothetical protein